MASGLGRDSVSIPDVSEESTNKFVIGRTSNLFDTGENFKAKFACDG